MKNKEIRRKQSKHLTAILRHLKGAQQRRGRQCFMTGGLDFRKLTATIPWLSIQYKEFSNG